MWSWTPQARTEVVSKPSTPPIYILQILLTEQKFYHNRAALRCLTQDYRRNCNAALLFYSLCRGLCIPVRGAGGPASSCASGPRILRAIASPEALMKALKGAHETTNGNAVRLQRIVAAD